MEKQCECICQHEDDLDAREIKPCMEKPELPLPNLIESDDESDGDSLSSEPVLESGGEMVNNDDRYWCDHPINDRDIPELPTFEQIDSPVKSPEEAPSKSPEEAAD